MDKDKRRSITRHFDQIIETLQNGYLLLDRHGVIHDVNPAFCKLTGYDREELLNSNINEYRTKSTADDQEKFFDRVVEEGSTSFETKHLSKSGKRINFWGSATAVDVGDDEIYIAEFLRDVTERKEEERKFEAIFNSMYQFIGLMKPDGTLLEANSTALEFGGLEENDVVGKYFWEAPWWQNDKSTQRDLKEAIKKAAEGEFVRYEVDVLGVEGAVETIDFSIKPVFDDSGEVELLIPEGRVITDKKKVQDRLKQSQQQLKSLFDHNPNPVYLFDLEGNFVRVNDKLVAFTGKSREELLDMSFVPFVHEDDLDETFERFQKAASGDPQEYEIRVTVQDGKEKEIRVNKFPMYEGDEIKGVFGILEDISEQKRRKKELEESEARWQSLVESTPQGIIIMVDGEIDYVNKAAVELADADHAEEIIGTPVLDHVPERYHELIRTRMRKLLAGKKIESYEFELGNRTVRTHPVPIKYKQGEAILSVLNDITELKEKQNKLERSEQKWQHLVEDNPQPVYVTIDGEFVFINEAGAEIYGADSPEDLIGKTVFEFSHPEDIEKIEERKHRLENDLPVDNIHEHKILTKDGDKRYVEVNSIPVKYQGKQAIQTVLFDITDRKEKEAVIEASLKEKEVLLKEIHHRVKNNMAVISGLLELQAMSSDDDELKDLLKQSQLRISSMAMVHEKLYQTESFSGLSFDGYVKQLVHTIKQTVDVATNRIELAFNNEEVSLDINKAIPAALIINEVVVNSFKHAFKGKESGKIAVSVGQENGDVRVAVEDNGVGLPEDFDLRTQSSLGVSLIQTLANQLGADLSIKSEDGTYFQMSFPKMSE